MTPRTTPPARPKGTQAQITPRASQNNRILREIARYCKTGGCTRFSVIWGGGRAPSAERVARGGDQARRRRRARSAHATGAERVARGGASWHAGAARASSRSSNAGRLLPASATLTSFVGGIKTMSPAPGRRPPIYLSICPRAADPCYLPLPTGDRPVYRRDKADE